MPWIEATDPPAEVPAHYEWPRLARAVSLTENDKDFAVGQRRYWVQHREEMLRYQKVGREDAKFFKSEANEALRQQRGWDAVVKYLEGNTEIYRHAPPVSQEIAPYLDHALNAIVFR